MPPYMTAERKNCMARKMETINGGAAGPAANKIGDAEVKDAFRTIIEWIGEDPDRDGLKDTPQRLVRAYREYFCGYDEDPQEVLRKTFSEVDGYDEMIVLRGVTFESHCEHHIAPIIGRAWVGYLPDRRGVHKRGSDLVTSRMLGVFRDQEITRSEFLSLVNAGTSE